MSEILALAARCEASAESDRQLDLEIWRAITGKHWLWHHSFPEHTVIWWNQYGAGASGNPVVSLERFSASLDDAMSLMLPGAVWTLEDRLAWIRLLDDRAPDGVAEYQSMAFTTPLAICAAVLKARAGRALISTPRGE